MSEVNASELIIPKFHDILGDVMAHGHTNYWLHGGRGSTKSSFISLCIVLLIVAFPYSNAVVVRRFGNTLRDSVFHQVIWSFLRLASKRISRRRFLPWKSPTFPRDSASFSGARTTR